MRANLVLQEGPGAGSSCLLDPGKQPAVSVGRSANCNIVLQDHRASRHHADIRWGGRFWQVVDLGSTNGTYVNGMRVHQPYDLTLGDRITIGETTLVLRELSRAPAGPIGQSSPGRREAASHSPVASATPQSRPSTASTIVFWLVCAVIAVAAVCLATGAFLPWLRVTGSLSEDMGPLIQNLTDIMSSVLGPDSLFHLTQEIGGLEGFGKLTLGAAVVCAIALVVDIFFARRSVVAGIVYLLSGLFTVGAMASDLINVYSLYKQIETQSLLLGIQMGEVVELLDRFVKMEVTPLIGLHMTMLGIGLLVVGGIGRLVVALLDRSKQ